MRDYIVAALLLIAFACATSETFGVYDSRLSLPASNPCPAPSVELVPSISGGLASGGVDWGLQKVRDTTRRDGPSVLQAGRRRENARRLQEAGPVIDDLGESNDTEERMEEAIEGFFRALGLADVVAAKAGITFARFAEFYEVAMEKNNPWHRQITPN